MSKIMFNNHNHGSWTFGQGQVTERTLNGFQNTMDFVPVKENG